MTREETVARMRECALVTRQSYRAVVVDTSEKALS
jgi:hypothetical protein